MSVTGHIAGVEWRESQRIRVVEVVSWLVEEHPYIQFKLSQH